MRIASLVPSVTDTLLQLGAGAELVAVTNECRIPADLNPRIVTLDPFGNTEYSPKEIAVYLRMLGHAAQEGVFAVDQEALIETKPNIVFIQGTCELCAPGASVEGSVVFEGLPSDTQVMSFAPHSLGEVLSEIRRIGNAIGHAPEAETLIGDLRRRMMETMRQAAIAARGHRPRVALLEWVDPPIAGGMWLPELIEAAGGTPVVGTRQAPAVQTPWQDIVGAQPDVLIFALTAFDLDDTVGELPLLRKREKWSAIPAVRSGEVYLLDARNALHRASPKIIDGLELLAAILHPESFERDAFAGMILQATEEQLAPIVVS